MATDNQTLIDELITITQVCTTAVVDMKNLPEANLNSRPSPQAWSALECLEHLNRYGDYYLPAIDASIAKSPRSNGEKRFRSGWIGNYFANLMRVKSGRLKKMKSPADKNPAGADLSIDTLERFLLQQDELLRLLKAAREADLVRAKVPITIAPWLRLRLGDTLRFFVYHIERHVLQAQRASTAG